MLSFKRRQEDINPLQMGGEQQRTHFQPEGWQSIGCSYISWYRCKCWNANNIELHRDSQVGELTVGLSKKGRLLWRGDNLIKLYYDGACGYLEGRITPTF